MMCEITDAWDSCVSLLSWSAYESIRAKLYVKRMYAEMKRELLEIASIATFTFGRKFFYQFYNRSPKV